MGRKKKRQKFTPYHQVDPNLSEDSLTLIQQETHNLFNKKFTLKDREKVWVLPDSECLLKNEPFAISELLALKQELNSTKSLLNDMDIEQWHQHTRRTHKAGQVVWDLRQKVQAEMCTQAWAKFYEILGTFDVIPGVAKEEMFSVHLCEAPGAFISSVNHYVKTHFSQLRWQWLATTLNPYYEGNDLNAMLDDDTFILETLKNWNFGLDGTGNLMNLKNLGQLKQACEWAGSVHLVIFILTAVQTHFTKP